MLRDNHDDVFNVCTTAMAFWKNGSLAELILREISDACVDTAQKQLVSSGVTGDNPA